MRAFILVLLAAATASADPVRDLVVQTVPTHGGGPPSEAILTKDAVIVTVRGSVQHDFEGLFLGPFLNTIGDIAYGLSSLEVVSDPRGFAWFYGAVDVTIAMGGKAPPLRVPLRVSGIVVGGKLAALMYASPLDDKVMIQIAEATKTKPATGAPKLAGDVALGKLAADWFTGPHLARDRGSSPKVWAAGTAPKELGAGAAAAKLAAGWDTLHLGATKIDARMFAGGDVGFVTATVLLPAGKVAAEMVLGAVVVKEPAGYRWVTLSFTPTSDPKTGFDPNAH